MEWSSPSEYDPSTYRYLQNLAMTTYINSERSVLLTFELEFTVNSLPTRSAASVRLDVYRTSSLGLLTSQLTSYSGVQTGTVELCIPTGRFQLAFLAYSDFCCVSSDSFVRLSELQLTERECAPPTQTGYCEHLIKR